MGLFFRLEDALFNAFIVVILARLGVLTVRFTWACTVSIDVGSETVNSISTSVFAML